jgi:AP endonuclease-1
MPKRKAVQAPVVDDSDLSPPPNNLDEGAAALANVNADLNSTTQQPTKKRKTASSIVKTETATETANGTVATTQRRIARTRKVKPEPEEEESACSSEEAPKPAPKKRQPKAKVVKKEDPEEEEKPIKKKRKTKEEKEAEAMPLSARTIGHKLFIGAHVSSAGGQYFHIQPLAQTYNYNRHIFRISTLN